MCTGNKPIDTVKTNLRYVSEDIDSALSAAKEVKDPTLTKKLTEIKDKTENVKAYIAERTDSKKG